VPIEKYKIKTTGKCGVKTEKSRKCRLAKSKDILLLQTWLSLNMPIDQSNYHPVVQDTRTSRFIRTHNIKSLTPGSH